MVAQSPVPVPPRLIGAPLPTVEARRFLAGRGQYVDDLVLPGMLHAAFVRSPHAHARLGTIDIAAARARPGVAAVLTGAEARERANRLHTPLNVPHYRDVGAHALAWGKVRFAGEPVAVVAAESRYLAEDACEAIVVHYEPLPAVVDPAAALAPGAPLLYEELGENVLVRASFQGGDPEAMFARAEVVLRETFYSQRQSGNPLEPRGLVARWAPEK